MYILTPAKVKENWPVLRELLGRAVIHNRGELGVDDILKLVEQEKMGVAVYMDHGEVGLAVAFEIITYPAMKVMNIAFAGGKNLHTMFTDGYQIADLAKYLKVDAVRCSCRPSMARYLKRLSPDVEQAYTVLEWKVPQ